MTSSEQATSRLSLSKLIWICLGTITAVFLVSAAGAMIAGGAVSRALNQFNDRALPPQAQVAALGKAYVDQETGQRGFMLTGDQVFLVPYVAGGTAADRLVGELEDSLAGDSEAMRALNGVAAAARDWVTNAAEPQIAARRAGPIPRDELAAMTVTGMGLFDELRERHSALKERTNQLIAQQFDRVRAAQRIAMISQVAAALVLLLGIVVADRLFRRILTRPVARMLGDVTAVADGDYDRTISGAGCREVAALATATETMRGSLRGLLIEKEQISTERAEAEVRYRILADNAVDVIAHLRGREVVWISQSAETAFGWPLEQWIGSDFSARVRPDDVEPLVARLDAVTDDEPTVVRCRVCTADEGYRWVEFRCKPYIDAQGNPDGVLAAARIVDEQVEAEQQLKASLKRFEAVVANAPSAISVRDLSRRYTLVNDAFCQFFGEPSAAGVVGRREDEVLSPDVLERSRLAEARLLAGESLMEEESISRGPETLSVMTQRFPLRNSVGAIAELVTIRTDITHRRKVEREAAERALWAKGIEEAIGDGRLLVYSQPIVDIATRATVAEELLVRLRDANAGEILPPCGFLPECERYGLIPVIDRYMLEQAVRLARTGREVSVNITGQTIGDPVAMNQILHVLATAGPDVTGKIIFEITETMALTSPKVATMFSRGMRDLGCRVALDDFGTGYGAFTELRNLALDALKIDLSFVRNMLEDRDDERVVKTIVFVAQEYGLTTVAEGVETEALVEKLAELGVDRAQGYFFGKPKPVVW